MELEVFPNPANDHLTVRYNRLLQGNNLSMEIFDVSGKRIYSHVITNEPFGFDINTQNFSQGLYVYRIMQEGVSGKTGKFQIIR